VVKLGQADGLSLIKMGLTQSTAAWKISVLFSLNFFAEIGKNIKRGSAMEIKRNVFPRFDITSIL
jgi:hypothetical protein